MHGAAALFQILKQSQHHGVAAIDAIELETIPAMWRSRPIGLD